MAKVLGDFSMGDVICAVATTPGIGAISIVRVTGIGAIEKVNSLFRGKNLLEVKSHTVSYGHIVDKDKSVDEVLVVVMKGPKTYTMEDIVEINCHGGINTTKKVMELLLVNGCRLAEPGEFTKRAFLNGRINLLEAESVNDLIVAKTDASRTLALNNVDGKLTKIIKNLREKMVHLLSNIEVNIDYPEYTDEVQVTSDLMKKYIKEIKEELSYLVKGSKCGRIIREGINVAIIGKPNVGKSSILNHLLDEDKAIVTDIAGTTRDIVEGSISLNGVLLNFIDTAGIRATNDVVEKIGVDKSKEMAKKADLILFVLNANEDITDDEKLLLESFDKDKVIVLYNKDDLGKKTHAILKNYVTVYGNTLDIKGLDNLKKVILDKFSLESIVHQDMCYLSNLRQIDLIEKANRAIESAEISFQAGLSVDVIEIDIREAWEYLGQLIGESYQDELVDNIFSHFCLGK